MTGLTPNPQPMTQKTVHEQIELYLDPEVVLLPRLGLAGPVGVND